MRVLLVLPVLASGIATQFPSSVKVAALFQNGSAELDDAFGRAYAHFANTFDHGLYEQIVHQIEQGTSRYNSSAAYRGYGVATAAPHCDTGVAAVSLPVAVRGLSAFPGGVVGSVFGFDLGKRLYDLSQHATGPASVGLVAPVALNAQALSTGMGLLQSSIAAMLHVVPPLVGPPAWNNQPLSCVPMISGHNCFGSILHPITMADFMIADLTDSMLDGYIAGFPGMYARKVGKTSDDMYKSCFAAYMSMMCSSVFPRCTTPQSRDELVPVGGAVPICLHMCVLPLVMCPGFWMNDLLGGCSDVSAPPMCTQASFVNTWRLPPQYASYDEANPFAPDCPEAASADASDAGLTLYDVSPPPESPIERAAKRVITLD